jgi:hypothetical protein
MDARQACESRRQAVTSRCQVTTYIMDSAHRRTCPSIGNCRPELSEKFLRFRFQNNRPAPAVRTARPGDTKTLSLDTANRLTRLIPMGIQRRAWGLPNRCSAPCPRRSRTATPAPSAGQAGQAAPHAGILPLCPAITQCPKTTYTYRVYIRYRALGNGADHAQDYTDDCVRSRVDRTGVGSESRD